MDDIRARNIADIYFDSIRQAKRIGVPQEHIPFVAVCFTVDDCAAGRERDKAEKDFKRKQDILRRTIRECIA